MKLEALLITMAMEALANGPKFHYNDIVVLDSKHKFDDTEVFYECNKANSWHVIGFDTEKGKTTYELSAVGGASICSVEANESELTLVGK